MEALGRLCEMLRENKILSVSINQIKQQKEEVGYKMLLSSIR